MKEKKKKLSTDEKFANAEKVLIGKQVNPKAREMFANAIKSAATPKPRGSK